MALQCRALLSASSGSESHSKSKGDEAKGSEGALLRTAGCCACILSLKSEFFGLSVT